MSSSVLIHPDDRAACSEALARATDPAGDGALRTEIRVLHPDRGGKWLAINAQTFFETERHRAVLMSGMAAEITERKRVEEQLRQSEEKFKLLFERSPLPKWAFESETLRFVDVNEAAVKHYGYSREEFLT